MDCDFTYKVTLKLFNIKTSILDLKNVVKSFENVDSKSNIVYSDDKNNPNKKTFGFRDSINKYTNQSQNIFVYFYFLKYFGIIFLIYFLILSPIIYVNFSSKNENSLVNDKINKSFLYRSSIMNKDVLPVLLTQCIN